MTQLKVVRAVLRKRGYLVLWQPDFAAPFYVGRIVREIGGEGFNLGNFAVRAKTTRADFLTQQRLMKKLEPVHFKHCSPTAQVAAGMRYKPLFWKVTRTKQRGD